MSVPGADARIEPMGGVHADAVLAIYQAGIEEGNATFESRAPDWADFTATRLPAHRFVAIEAGRVAGWAAASAVSGRCVYAGVVEHSVYVHPAARSRGIGRLLLNALIASTEAAGIWTIQSGIFPENTASLALHQATGFRIVGTRERIGQHYGRWRDVVLIERRSPAVLTAPGQGPDAAAARPDPAEHRDRHHRRPRLGSSALEALSIRPGRCVSSGPVTCICMVQASSARQPPPENPARSGDGGQAWCQARDAVGELGQGRVEAA